MPLHRGVGGELMGHQESDHIAVRSPLDLPRRCGQSWCPGYATHRCPACRGEFCQVHHRDGCMTPLECEMLAIMFLGKTVLEIGTGLCLTTEAIGKAAKELMSIDRDKPVELTLPPGVSARVGCSVVGQVLHDNQLLKGRYFDAAFIDGHDASSDLVRRDIVNALRRLKPGGLLVLHDFRRVHVRRAVLDAGLPVESFLESHGLGVYFMDDPTTRDSRRRLRENEDAA